MFTKRLITRLVFTSLIVASLFFSGLGITPVHAASIIVNTDVDETTTNGLCSLREAMHNANNDAVIYPDCAAGLGADTITFAGNYTITLAGAQLPFVASEIVINGNGVENTIIQAAASPNIASSSVFGVGSNGNLTLDALTIRHGRDFIAGGGIYVNGNAILAVKNSVISANNAQIGGAIFASRGSSITVTSSILSGNRGENYGGAIVNSGGTVNITNSTLSGNSALSGGGAIVNIVPPPTFTSNLTVIDSTLSGNSVDNFGGGAIYNGQFQNTTIINSTISGNYAPMGGGIYNDGNLWLGNVTISGNEAYDYGGGIYSDGSAWIHNSTIVFNTLIEGTPLGAGGIDGDVALYNSIVAGNTRAISSEYRDCNGTIFSWGHNLFRDTTNCNIIITFTSGSWDILNSLNLLGPLQNNGGATQTHALLLGSNAIDTGDNINFYCASWPVSNVDQRGVSRPQGSACDVGAFEWKNEPPTNILLSASTISENLLAGTTIGTLTAIDSDLGDTHTYSFCGGVDDTVFSLVGDTLNTAAVFDFEAQSTFNICIRVTDAANTSFDKAFEILVLDVPENPAPETTMITMKVRKPKGISNYMFLFTSSVSDSTFMCRMDQEAFSPCKNAITYSGLSTGLHTFQVYAIEPTGNPDLTPSEYSFTVNP